MALAAEELLQAPGAAGGPREPRIACLEHAGLGPSRVSLGSLCSLASVFVSSSLAPPGGFIIM